MVIKSYKYMLMLCFSFFAGSLYADSNDLQRKLEQHIRDCKLEEFKAGYGVVKAACTSEEEKEALRGFFELIVQQTKKEKIAELSVLSPRFIKAYWPLMKCIMQSVTGSLLAILGIGGVYSYFYATGYQAHLRGDINCIRLGSAFFIAVLPFLYCAKHNGSKAFHYDHILKRDIEILDEIMAYMESALS